MPLRTKRRNNQRPVASQRKRDRLNYSKRHGLPADAVQEKIRHTQKNLANLAQRKQSTHSRETNSVFMTRPDPYD